MNLSPEPLQKAHLLGSIPEREPKEHFEELFSGRAFRVERIVSQGHHSPMGIWYDQEEPEWVLLMRGQAELEIEGRESLVELKPGDAILLPAHCRHRVASTDPHEPTIWLAIHFEEQGSGPLRPSP